MKKKKLNLLNNIAVGHVASSYIDCRQSPALQVPRTARSTRVTEKETTLFEIRFSVDRINFDCGRLFFSVRVRKMEQDSVMVMCCSGSLHELSLRKVE